MRASLLRAILLALALTWSSFVHAGLTASGLAQAGTMGLSVDGMYVEIGNIEQVSFSAVQIIKRNHLSGKIYAEYFYSDGRKRWKVGANGNYAGLDLAYERTVGRLLAELGLSKEIVWNISLGFLWRTEWGARWVPNEEGENFAVMKLKWDKTVLFQGMPVGLVAENKQVAGAGLNRSEWRLLGDVHIKKLFIRVERRWDLSKIALGVKL